MLLPRYTERERYPYLCRQLFQFSLVGTLLGLLDRTPDPV